MTARRDEQFYLSTARSVKRVAVKAASEDVLPLGWSQVTCTVNKTGGLAENQTARLAVKGQHPCGQSRASKVNLSNLAGLATDEH